MLKFHQVIDENGKVLYIKTALKGLDLLNASKLNKGCAFTKEEREKLNLLGRLPERIETLDDQVERIYEQYLENPTDIQKNIYLTALHDNNETLFYKLVEKHLKEILPIIYTPTVGTAVEQFSHAFRRFRGLYISYNNQDKIDKILEHRMDPDVDLIVVTDGEGVLGIGDQGVGGMEIPIAKLMVYSLCGGINPHRVLPIQLDVGTNNQKLLDDPMYLGWRHNRLSGQEYDDFINKFVSAVKKKFPHVFLHWEDFGRNNARKNLERYRNEICSFNDDMQGTGAVTLAAILAAVNASGTKITDQRVVVFGAGTAGVGITDQIFDAMVRSGLSEKQARERFWLLDIPGLLIEGMPDLADFQKPYARTKNEVSNWRTSDKGIDLAEVVKQVKPTILIGCSTLAGAFSKDIITTMAKHTKHPIIFPLSNPTPKAEAHPKDLLEWTNGKALIATGSPFADVDFQGKMIRISQCNNAFVFPGIGMGVIVSRAKLLTDDMIWEACKALADSSPAKSDASKPILPDLSTAKAVSMNIAFAVAKQARKDGLAQIDKDKDLKVLIKGHSWEAKYYEYREE